MKYLVASLLLVFFVATGSGIKCYQCIYYEDNVGENKTLDACKDTEGLKTLEAKDCAINSTDTNSYHCIKRDGKTIDDELKYIERGCSPTKNSLPNECKGSNALDTPFGMAERASMCLCDTDGCNGAPGTFQPTLHVFLISFFFIFSSIFLL